MRGLLGKKKQDPKKVDIKQKLFETMKNLGKKISDLEEQCEFLEIEKNSQNEAAKLKLKAGDKNGAKQALAKIKKFDEQMKQYYAEIMMMEEQKMLLENAVSLKDIHQKVDRANKVLNDSTKGFSVDELDIIRNNLSVRR
jgi:hypothetical protein